MKHLKRFTQIIEKKEEKEEKKILFRDHRGSLKESEKTIKEYTYTELEKHIKDLYEDSEGFTIKKYTDTPDERIKWDKTYIVMMKLGKNEFPVGFSNDKF